jgi:hypothetical protein
MVERQSFHTSGRGLGPLFLCLLSFMPQSRVSVEDIQALRGLEANDRKL